MTKTTKPQPQLVKVLSVVQKYDIDIPLEVQHYASMRVVDKEGHTFTIATFDIYTNVGDVIEIEKATDKNYIVPHYNVVLNQTQAEIIQRFKTKQK